jgi:hypothetical protein
MFLASDRNSESLLLVLNLVDCENNETGADCSHAREVFC